MYSWTVVFIQKKTEFRLSVRYFWNVLSSSLSTFTYSFIKPPKSETDSSRLYQSVSLYRSSVEVEKNFFQSPFMEQSYRNRLTVANQCHASCQILDMAMLKLFCHNTLTLSLIQKDLVYYQAKVEVVEEGRKEGMRRKGGRGDGRNKYVSLVLCHRLL